MDLSLGSTHTFIALHNPHHVVALKKAAPVVEAAPIMSIPIDAEPDIAEEVVSSADDASTLEEPPVIPLTSTPVLAKTSISKPPSSIAGDDDECLVPVHEPSFPPPFPSPPPVRTIRDILLQREDRRYSVTAHACKHDALSLCFNAVHVRVNESCPIVLYRLLCARTQAVATTTVIESQLVDLIVTESVDTCSDKEHGPLLPASSYSADSEDVRSASIVMVVEDCGCATQVITPAHDPDPMDEYVFGAIPFQHSRKRVRI